MKHMVQKAGLLAARHGWDAFGHLGSSKEAKDALLNRSDESYDSATGTVTGYNGHYRTFALAGETVCGN